MSGGGIPEPVRRTDEKLALLDWPVARAAGDILIGPNDCLVAAMGFEERAVAGLRRACEKSREFHVALVRYLPAMTQNRSEEFHRLCETHNLYAEEFVYDRENPSGMGSALAQHANRYDKVYVDVSGMSRLLIVQTLVGLVRAEKNCVILYSEARIYPPLKREFDEARSAEGRHPAFISSGIIEVVSSPELSSVAMLGSPIRLMSFPSFDPSQLSNLVQEVQPTHNDVVFGRSPRVKLGWRTDAVDQINKATLDMLQRVEVHEVCTFDYRVTLTLILDLYRDHSTFDRIVIAPTGSKMQSVAIGIVRGMLEDLQIVYPTPRRFLEPDRYTEGVREVFQLPLNLGDLAVC